MRATRRRKVRRVLGGGCEARGGAPGRRAVNEQEQDVLLRVIACPTRSAAREIRRAGDRQLIERRMAARERRSSARRAEPSSNRPSVKRSV